MGAKMRNVLEHLFILVAEALDRSLLTVPELDDYNPGWNSGARNHECDDSPDKPVR
jgi:hypothetical protein